MAKLIGILKNDGQISNYFFKNYSNFNFYGSDIMIKEITGFRDLTSLWEADSFCLVEVKTRGKVEKKYNPEIYKSEKYSIIKRISNKELIEEYRNNPNWILFKIILKSEKLTIEELEELLTINKTPIGISSIFDSSKFVSDSIINKLLDSNTIIIGYKGIKKLINRPETSSDTLYKIANRIIEKEGYEVESIKLMIIDIINHPNLTEELLDKIIDLFLFNIKIFLKNKISKTEMQLYIYEFIKSPILSETSFEKLLEELSGHKTISDLYTHINETADLNLFERLLQVEKTLTNKMCENNIYDNKLDFRKEYFKTLNKYLSSNILGIRLAVLKMMIQEKYLTKKEIFNPDCIKKCPRTLKLCSQMDEIK